MKQTHTRRGFTLIELLVVIFIIGILVAIAGPQYAKSRERAYTVEALTLLRALAQAQRMYYFEHETYATSFDDLGIDVQLETDNAKFTNIAGYLFDDVRSSKQWDIGLISNKRGVFANGAIVALRRTGNYTKHRYGGLNQAGLIATVNDEDISFWCWEQGVAKPPYNYCKDMFNGRYVAGDSSGGYYEINLF